MPEIGNIERYISELDTNRFGFKVAKSDFSDIEPEETVSELKKYGVKLVISRIDGKNIDLINKLEDLGFRVMDNQLKYRFDLKDVIPDYSDEFREITVREVNEKDVTRLVEFTEDSFAGYGHYFADKRLDEQRSLEIYKDWIRRSCADRNVADRVFVAEFGGDAIGYLTFKIFEKENVKYAAGGLGAVSKDHRNKSVFRAITLHGLRWGKALNLEWEEHNVLSTNYSVNRSFSGLGFRIVDSYVTFHGWLDQLHF